MNKTKTVGQFLDTLMLISTKEVLTSNEVARYMGISKSHLYKLTMRNETPHYKPMGKMCYFNRVEVEQWLQRNRVDNVDSNYFVLDTKKKCLRRK